MAKTIIATIIIDDVELSDLNDLSDAIDELVKDYEFKRVDINLSDNPMVRPPASVG